MGAAMSHTLQQRQRKGTSSRRRLAYGGIVAFAIMVTTPAWISFVPKTASMKGVLGRTRAVGIGMVRSKASGSHAARAHTISPFRNHKIHGSRPLQAALQEMIRRPARTYSVCPPSDQAISPELKTTASDYPQLINGELRPGGLGVFPVKNPANDQVFACAPDASKEDLDEAVAAARQAFPAWSRRTYAERLKLLEDFADRVMKNTNSIAAVLTKEQGKPLAAARGEVASTLGRISAMEQLGPLEPKILYEDDDSRTEVHHKPYGIVAAITPWNFPVLIAISKLTSALLAGNTVVVKPSPYTPLSTLMLAQAAVESGLPPGVLNIISGGDDLGKQLAEHPDINHISFTGSVSTGKKVMETAAKMLKRVTLELGGNDAAIVLKDVDVDKAAEKIFFASMANTGQICTAIKRLYVHEDVFEPMCEALKKCAAKAKIGDGSEKGTTHGPLNNEMQLNIVKGLLEDAKKNGAEVLCGGEAPEGPGYFFPPTLVTGIKEGVSLVDEEQFGPVLPIMKFKDVDDAISRANDSPFGLGGSVWTTDASKGAEIASQLDTGVTWVNAHITGDFKGTPPPFGGAKMSGIGREHGRAGLEEYTELKTIRVAKNL